MTLHIKFIRRLLGNLLTSSRNETASLEVQCQEDFRGFINTRNSIKCEFLIFLFFTSPRLDASNVYNRISDGRLVHVEAELRGSSEDQNRSNHVYKK